MKKVLMLIMALVMVNCVVKAQFRDSERAYIYCPVDGDVESSLLYLIAFSEGNAYIAYNVLARELRKEYKKDPSLLSYLKNPNGQWINRAGGTRLKYDYDSSNTTSQRTTYRRKISEYIPYYYFSFSKDKRTLIKWYQYKEEKISKENYYLIDITIFSPESKDFLYE